MNQSPTTGGRFGLELTFTNAEMIELARTENGVAYSPLYERLFAEWTDAIRLDFPEVLFHLYL